MTGLFRRWMLGYGRVGLLCASALLAAGIYCFGAGLYAGWAAVAVLLVCLPFLWDEIAPLWTARWETLRPETADRIQNLWPYLAVGVVTLIVLYPVSLFQMPVSQDHVNHYFATHILVHEMIPSGRIFGWTDRIGTGYPFGDIYHIAPYFLTAFLHLISFGLIPLSASYAFGITVVWLVTAFAAVAWTKRLTGSWGATVAGLLTTLDAGGDREGGWGYAMFHGVWPQHLSTGVWLFALLALFRLYEKLDTRRLGVAALLTGVCLWLHPMSAVIVLLSGVVLLAVCLFGPRSEDRPPSVLPLFAALLAAGLIGLVWIIRMMVNGDVVYAFSSEWSPVVQLMDRLLRGEMFANQLLIISPAALAGAAALALRKRRFDLLSLLLLLALLLVGSMDLIIPSDAGLFGGGIGLIQYRRFSIPAKPLFYAAAGVGFSVLLGGIRDFVKRRQTSPAATHFRPATRILLALLAAPFVYGLAHASQGLVRSPAARPLTLDDTEDKAGLEEVRRVLATEQQRCKHKPCSAVYWEKPGHGGLYPVLSLADLDYRWIPMLKLPANNFDFQGIASNVDTMARLGAVVAVSKWKQTDPGLKSLGKFGKHFVYRILSQKDGRVEIDGPGKYTIEKWSAEHREIALTSTGPGTRLTLPSAPYDKWRGTLNGKPISLNGKKEGSLYVTAVSGINDGKLVLTYRDSPVENLFFFLGFGVFFGACVLAVRSPRPLSALRLDRLEPAAGKILAVGLVTVIFGGVVALGVAGQVAARRYWLAGEPLGTTLNGVLHERSPARVEFAPHRICVRPYTRDPRFGCAEQDYQPTLIAAPRRRGAMPSCLQVGIPSKGRTTLSFDLPKGTTNVKGMLHLLDGNRLDVIGSAGQRKQMVQDIQKSSAFDMPVSSDHFELVLSGDVSRACIEAVALSR